VQQKGGQFSEFLNMEGTPVRGTRRVPFVQLNECPNLECFQSEIVRLASSEFKHSQVFFGVVDPESKTLQLPAWVQSHLGRHPGLHKKLECGEMVGISTTEGNAETRSTATNRMSAVLIPVRRQETLMAAIGLASTPDEPPLSAEDTEIARLLAYDAAPILARLQEIEDVRLEQRRLLAQLERMQRLEEEVHRLREERNSLEAVRQMHSHQQVNIAHELRTPLAAIRGYVRMILDGRCGAINEKQGEYLRIVTDNTNRMITLVAWMSQVAELSSQHLKLSTFDFRDVWRECADGCRQQLAGKSLKLHERLASESFLMFGDPEKIADALNELVGVGVRLAEAGGTITVELSHGRDGEVSFKLTDKGSKIPADVLSKIFDRPVNTIGKATAQNTQSSTISLSGVYDVVGMHGGRIFVSNTAGQGATFLFTLPAVTAGGEENSHEQAINLSRRRR
jgi:signal transduction histidine kinase